MAPHDERKPALVDYGHSSGDCTKESTAHEHKEAGWDVESGTVVDSETASVPEGVERREKARIRHKCTIAFGVLGGAAALCAAVFFIIYTYNIKHSPPPTLDIINCEGAPWNHNGININVSVVMQATSHASPSSVIDFVNVDVHYPDKESGVYLGTVAMNNLLLPALSAVTAEGKMCLTDVVHYPRGLGTQLINERMGQNTTTHLQMHAVARAHSRIFNVIKVPYKMRAVCSFKNTWSTGKRHTDCHVEMLPWWAKIGV